MVMGSLILVRRSMTLALNLTVRHPIEVMRVVTAFFAGSPDIQIVFEGDISAIDWGTLPGATTRDDSRIAIVPLTPATADTLMRSVFSRIGLRSRIWHITIYQRDQRLFASYDKFQPCMVVIEAPQHDLLLSKLQEAGLVISHATVNVDKSNHETHA